VIPSKITTTIASAQRCASPVAAASGSASARKTIATTTPAKTRIKMCERRQRIRPSATIAAMMRTRLAKEAGEDRPAM
jgi:hypothetical protein